MPTTLKPLIYLASASPRRSVLLTQIGIAHRVRPSEIDERLLPNETPQDYVTRLARTKAQVLWGALAPAERLPVLGADTTVTADGDILGKPRDRVDGIGMLSRLSGKTHQVFTAVALCHDSHHAVRLSRSEVTFRSLSNEEIAAYWDSGEPADKAGGYGVQGLAAIFIERISGSYSGIMGLPLFETAELLRLIGWRLPSLADHPIASMTAQSCSGARG
jgi:septum formation protein